MFKDSKAFSGFAVKDLAAAKTFYGDTLGLDARDGPMDMLELHLGSGAVVLVYPKEDHQAANYTMLNLPGQGRRCRGRSADQGRRPDGAVRRGLRPGRRASPGAMKAPRSPGSRTRPATSSPCWMRVRRPDRSGIRLRAPSVPARDRRQTSHLPPPEGDHRDVHDHRRLLHPRPARRRRRPGDHALTTPNTTRRGPSFVGGIDRRPAVIVRLANATTSPTSSRSRARPASRSPSAAAATARRATASSTTAS